MKIIIIAGLISMVVSEAPLTQNSYGLPEERTGQINRSTIIVPSDLPIPDRHTSFSPNSDLDFKSTGSSSTNFDNGVELHEEQDNQVLVEKTKQFTDFVEPIDTDSNAKAELIQNPVHSEVIEDSKSLTFITKSNQHDLTHKTSKSSQTIHQRIEVPFRDVVYKSAPYPIHSTYGVPPLFRLSKPVVAVPTFHIAPNTLVSYTDHNNQYSNGYALSDGTIVNEHGTLINTGRSLAPVFSKVGHYEYISPEGIPIKVDWVADHNGYRAIVN